MKAADSAVDGDGHARSTKRRRMDLLIQLSRNFAGVHETRGDDVGPAIPRTPADSDELRASAGFASDSGVSRATGSGHIEVARKRTWTEEEDSKLRELVATLGSNWAAIAAEFPARDRKRVRERYVNHLNPALTRTPWSDDEDQRLMELQRELGSRWAKFAQLLPGRSPEDVKNRWLRLTTKEEGSSKNESLRWTKPESDLLRTLVEANGAKDWFFIASQIPGRTDLQCRQHWHRVLAPSIVKGRSKWSEDEDSLLTRKVDELGHQWEEIALFLPGRLGKQCRERYLNQLRPGIVVTPWTTEEDDILRHAYQLNPGQWAIITKQLPGRTENAIKNRWNSLRRNTVNDIQKK